MNTDACLWHIYHSLWGKAHDAPGYSKHPWNDLYKEVCNHQYVVGDCHLRREVVALALLQGVGDAEIQESLKMP